MWKIIFCSDFIQSHTIWLRGCSREYWTASWRRMHPGMHWLCYRAISSCSIFPISSRETSKMWVYQWTYDHSDHWLSKSFILPYMEGVWDSEKWLWASKVTFSRHQGQGVLQRYVEMWYWFLAWHGCLWLICVCLCVCVCVCVGVCVWVWGCLLFQYLKIK